MTDLGPHIVTDSTADIPGGIARRLGITVIPCHIHFGDETYREGVDISREEFYRRLRSLEQFTTSQPAVGVFAETYRSLLADGRPIVSIHLASRLSGVYNSAWLAANEVDSQRIAVVDGQQVSMCTGWLAIGAAEAARAGASAGEIIRQASERARRLQLFALIDDLRYLHRGGRVNWASSLLGNLFAIKPIIRVREGRADLVEKVRSSTRGLDRIVSLASSGRLERVAVLHADAPDYAAELAERMSRVFPRERLLITEAGTVVSGHAGPGAVGVACLMAG
jgi:DegV family protein with EDD domain